MGFHLHWSLSVLADYQIKLYNDFFFNIVNISLCHCSVSEDACIQIQEKQANMHTSYAKRFVHYEHIIVMDFYSYTCHLP